MELVYIWVEKFKNIKSEGFNLSPDYKFYFNSNNLVKNDFKRWSGNIEYEKNDKSIPLNFFGENITNLIAIIGKNGSGKSSLSSFIANAKLKRKKMKQYCKENDFFLIFKDFKNDFFIFQSGDKMGNVKFHLIDKKNIEEEYMLKKTELSDLDIIYYDNEVLKKPLPDKERRNINKIDISSQALLTEEKGLKSFSINEIKRNILFFNYFISGKEFEEQIDLNIPRAIYLGGAGLNVDNIEVFKDRLVNKLIIMIIDKMFEEIVVEIISMNIIKEDRKSVV